MNLDSLIKYLVWIIFFGLALAGLYFMLKIGLLIMVLGGVMMFVFGVRGDINVWVIMIPVIVYIVGSSMIFANAYAGAFHPFPTIAGTAGAIFGFLQILGGALSSWLMSSMKTYSQIPLSLVLAISAILAYIMIRILTNGYALEMDLSEMR